MDTRNDSLPEFKRIELARELVAIQAEALARAWKSHHKDPEEQTTLLVKMSHEQYLDAIDTYMESLATRADAA